MRGFFKFFGNLKILGSKEDLDYLKNCDPEPKKAGNVLIGIGALMFFPAVIGLSKGSDPPCAPG